MIIFAELAMVNEAHASFNATFLRMFLNRFPQEQITMYAEEVHCVAISKRLRDSRLGMSPFVCRGVSSKASLRRAVQIIVKEMVFLAVLWRIVRKARAEKVRYVVFTSVLPGVHLVIKMLAKIVLKNTRVIVVLHGEIESLAIKRSSYYSLLRWALKLKASDVTYVVLGDFIKRNLLQIIEMNGEKLLAIHQPVSFDTVVNPLPKQHPGWVFGSIGVQQVELKQSHLIFELARKLEEQVTGKAVVFKTVGTFGPGMERFANSLVDVALSGEGMLSLESYQYGVLSLDYVLLFYPPGSYRFISSGVFFDAIKYQKPVITFRNDFVEEYFALLGDIGYVVEDLDEMVTVIKNISTGVERVRYERQKANMLLAKEILSGARVGESLFKQL